MNEQVFDLLEKVCIELQETKNEVCKNGNKGIIVSAIHREKLKTGSGSPDADIEPIDAAKIYVNG